MPQKLMPLLSYTMKMKKWRLLLAESHKPLQQAVAEVLATMPRVNIVARVVNGWDVIFTSAQLQPDIILLDFNIPGLDALEVTSLIKRGLPQTPVVILLDKADEECLQAIRQSEALDHLLKEQLGQDLPLLLDRLEVTESENNN